MTNAENLMDSQLKVPHKTKKKTETREKEVKRVGFSTFCSIQCLDTGFWFLGKTSNQ